MPKKDLRSSFQEQLSAASRSGAFVEEEQAIADGAGALLAFTGASSSKPLLSGGYAYDPDEVVWIPVECVHDNPYQPRNVEEFRDVARLHDLIESFNSIGQQQPVAVRPHPDARLHPNEFQLVFGHRRKYAVKLGAANAGTRRPDALNLQKHIACLIRPKVSESEMLAIALEENDNREEMLPLDRARGYAKLQEMVSREMAETGEIPSLPDGTPARLASWRQVADRKGKQFRTLARVASLTQLPKAILEQFDSPGNYGFLTVKHGLALLTLQEHPQDQKRLLHDAIEQGWSGAETGSQADKRLRDILSRQGQTTIEGTEEAAKTEAKPRGGSSSGGSGSSGAKLSIVAPSAPSQTKGAEAPNEAQAPAPPAGLVEPVAPESANEALARKAVSFIEAAFNELGQISADGFDVKEVEWAQEHLKRARSSIRLAKNE